MYVADIRGWGHLTGTGGGMALSQEEAARHQDSWAAFIAAAANAVPSLLDRLSLEQSSRQKAEEEREQWRQRAADRDFECEKRFRAQHDATARAEKAEGKLEAMREALAPYVRAGEPYFVPNFASEGALAWPQDDPFGVTVRVAEAIRARSALASEAVEG